MTIPGYRSPLFFLLALLVLSSGVMGQTSYQKTKTGLRYLMLTAKPNPHKAFKGDVFDLSMIYKNDKDSVLFDNSRGQFKFTYTLREPLYSADLNEALALAGKGDSITFVLKADSFYLRTIGEKRLPKAVKKGSDLFFHVKVLDIIPAREFLELQLVMFEEERNKAGALQKMEKDSLDAYLLKNNITLKPDEIGLYTLHEVEGNGKHPENGEVAVIEYSVKSLSGKTFQSFHGGNGASEVKIGSHTVIRGLEEGLKSMRKGGKAKLLIPSNLAYAGQPTGDIPPFTTLVIDVTLLDIK